MNKHQPEKDIIFETITTRIIQKFDSTEMRYMVPKYQPQTPQFQINKTELSKDLLEKMEEQIIWQEMVGHVSPETYTARLLLYIMCKRPIPLFSSKNTFRIKQLIKELDNQFSSPRIREEIINYFCNFKKAYWAFTKLARIWKIQHTPIRIQTDLYMNELDSNHKYTFKLIHPNGIYLFSLQNLARIIVDAITHQTGMFVEPLTIKNPYTNGLLSKCDLFNIYFSLIHNHMRIHEMMEKFFRCEFNVFEFRRKHENELRDFAIDQYAKTAGISELAQDVDDMLRTHKMTKNINIAKEFPQKILVNTMRPFLLIYLLERYSFSSMTRKYSAKQLDVMLKQFTEKNPNFGKRAPVELIPLGSNPFSQPHLNPVAKYITETVSHSNYCKLKYMETHIYDDDIFDKYIEMGDSLNTYMEPLRRPYLLIPDESEMEWTDNMQQSPITIPSPIPTPITIPSPTPIPGPIPGYTTPVYTTPWVYISPPLTINRTFQMQENTRVEVNNINHPNINHPNIIEDEYADNEDNEEDNEDNEEVIQNTDDSDEEWENQRMEEEEDVDSIS